MQSTASRRAAGKSHGKHAVESIPHSYSIWIAEEATPPLGAAESMAAGTRGHVPAICKLLALESFRTAIAGPGMVPQSQEDDNGKARLPTAESDEQGPIQGVSAVSMSH
jgi:hypothetical protein